MYTHTVHTETHPLPWVCISLSLSASNTLLFSIKLATKYHVIPSNLSFSLAPHTYTFITLTHTSTDFTNRMQPQHHLSTTCTDAKVLTQITLSVQIFFLQSASNIVYITSMSLRVFLFFLDCIDLVRVCILILSQLLLLTHCYYSQTLIKDPYQTSFPVDT